MYHAPISQMKIWGKRNFDEKNAGFKKILGRNKWWVQSHFWGQIFFQKEISE